MWCVVHGGTSKLNDLTLIHYVGPTRHEIFVFAGSFQIGHENHLRHPTLGNPEPYADADCWATVAADIAIGLGITLVERRVAQEDYEPHRAQWHILDFSATTEWANKGGYGKPASGPE